MVLGDPLVRNIRFLGPTGFRPWQTKGFMYNKELKKQVEDQVIQEALNGDNIKKELINFTKLAIIAFLVFLTCATYIKAHTKEKLPLPVDQQPIFDTQIREDFKSGRISEDKAQQEIANHLNSLMADKYIQSWEADKNNKEFIVTLNDGTIFSYKLTKDS